jgi:LacI family transcriptional regulator
MNPYGKRAMRETTISDVAQAAGVSLRTVSRVLNASPKVNKETREKIEAVIDALGFAPSARARALATRKSFLVGLVYDDPNALVLDEVQRGMVEVCGVLGFEVVIHPCRYHAPELLDDIAAFVRRSRVDGVIVIPPVSERADVNEILARLGAPAVYITSVAVPGQALIAREREAACRMARRLAELGHRRIGFISGPPEFQSARERQAGFTSEMARHGCAVVMEEGDYSFASGLECGARLLSAQERPTAIFASNDSMAAGVFKAAARLGLAIPLDLSVVGFDDSEIARMLTPALTTIRRPMRDFAKEAILRLLARIDGQEVTAPTSGEDGPELSFIERDSAAAPRG